MIDVPIFVITMPERKQRVKEHLDSFGLQYKIFDTFNGKQLGITTKNPHLRDHPAEYWAPPYGVGTEPPFFAGSGIQALAMAWFALVKFGIMNNLPEMLVFEDDVILDPQFIEKYHALRKELPEDYHACWLGTCCMSSSYRVSPLLKRGYPLCTHAVLLTRKAMLEIDSKAVLMSPVDIFFFENIFPAGGVHVADPPLADQESLHGRLPTTLS